MPSTSSGTKYTTPTIKKLAEAMFEGHKVLDPSQHKSPLPPDEHGS
jgi:hypothetical protein